MSRIISCLTAGAASLLFLAPASSGLVTSASSAGLVSLRPNQFTAKPNGDTHATVGWASRNWSGYAATSTTYSGVQGNWNVPNVTGCSAGGRRPACYSAAWAGIDGFNNSSLIQTGTEQDFIGGSASYSAWWTTSANGFVEQTIGISHNGSDPCTNDSGHFCGTVSAGDSMTATMAISGGNGTITLKNNSGSHGWTFTITVPYSGPETSAEWIMEAPTVGGKIATMPNYNNFTFDPGYVNGANNPSLHDSDGGELIQKGKVDSIPSAPDSDTDGFTMAYGSIAPNPPSS
jgi:Peptidase A4 family